MTQDAFYKAIGLEDSKLALLFKDFSKSDISRLELTNFPTGSTVIHKECSSLYVYIILSGIAGVFKEVDNGENFCYYKISKHDTIGVSEVLSEKPKRRIANIVAITDITTLRITQSDFKQFTRKYPLFFNQLTMGIIHRLHKSLEFHVECKKYSASLNIVSYLIYSYEFYLKMANNNSSNPIIIDETRHMMSSFTGISARTINSTIEKLKSLGFISVQKGKISMDNLGYQKLLTYKIKHI